MQHAPCSPVADFGEFDIGMYDDNGMKDDQFSQEPESSIAWSLLDEEQQDGLDLLVPTSAEAASFVGVPEFDTASPSSTSYHDEPSIESSQHAEEPRKKKAKRKRSAEESIELSENFYRLHTRYRAKNIKFLHLRDQTWLHDVARVNAVAFDVSLERGKSVRIRERLRPCAEHPKSSKKESKKSHTSVFSDLDFDAAAGTFSGTVLCKYPCVDRRQGLNNLRIVVFYVDNVPVAYSSLLRITVKPELGESTPSNPLFPSAADILSVA